MKFFDNMQFSEPGDPIKTIYSPIVNEDGSISLKPSGKENLQDRIQSFAAECDINTLVARFAAGDLTALNKSQGMYGDFTDMPKTYAEFLQLQIDSKKYFDSLPVEVKHKFDDDSNKFLAQAGSKEWFEIMSSMYSTGQDDGLVIEKEEKGEVKE